MTTSKGRLAAGGRLVVPAEFRRRLGLQPGDTVVIELRGQELRVRSSDAALRRLQDRLAARRSPRGRASDELLAERRAEAAREASPGIPPATPSPRQRR